MKRYIITLVCMFSFWVIRAQEFTVPDGKLFNAFKQKVVSFQGIIPKFGSGGNCASIAVIKTAIGTFGVNNVFKSVKIDSLNEMVYVTLRNDSIVDLTFDRLGSAKAYFFINPDTDIVSQKISEYARLCFAVMCRVKQLEMGYDTKYFYRGIDALNKAQDASIIYKLLGLKCEYIKDLRPENLSKYKNIIVYNSIHAVYSSAGYYDEERVWKVRNDCPGFTATGKELLSDFSSFHCQKDGCDGSSCPISGAYILK